MDRNKRERIRAFCEKYQMFEKGDGIVVGLSGGADSVFLLHFMKSIQEEYDLRLYAVHVHHGIRGPEADRDQEYAKQCAQGLDISFESVHYDIPLLAKQDGMSEEEAGRYYRYQCFREVAKHRGCQRIAVAHHKEDQAETVLFQLLRGSGLRGMGGIRPHQDGIIRPLLSVSRLEIEEELRAEGIEWREDSTNQERNYARNKLRLEVIPYLQREIQPETVGHVAETALQLQTVWEYMHRQVRQAAERMIHREEGRIWLERSAFLELDAALQPYVLLELMAEVAGSRKDLGSVHIAAWMELIRGGTGKRISLPYHMQAGRDYDVIWLARTGSPGKRNKTEGCRVSGMSDGKVDWEESRLEKSREEPEKSGGLPVENIEQPGIYQDFAQEDTLPGAVWMHQVSRTKLSGGIPKNHCTKWFDYAKMNVGFVWRHPMPGDDVVIDRQGHTKKLSRILLEEKIPREKRSGLWVLADGKHILWVPQIRRTSMGYYVTEETKEVLVVQIDVERWKTL
ncbi:MAG: tRNA lysidine(34) synthetase TilS [Lachnospiraceae bacterium]|nr:tRNA lysidine(34) synthetase TilS [Lachnospiraceae bacterium]